jgi:hypothetical protein
MPWQKGQSGNPKGAPRKENSWAKIIKRIGDTKDPYLKRKNREAVADALFKQAKLGNVQASRLLAELEGDFSIQGKMDIRFSWLGEDVAGENSGPI